MRIAVLDDYQGVALTSADWAPVLGRSGLDGEPCTVEVFRDHVSEPAAPRAAPPPPVCRGRGPSSSASRATS
ncbi:MAG: hypothetical protein ABI336_07310 [Humibacillus sp.]